MPDVYQRDPSRLFLRTTTGDVQAWQPCGDPSASLRAGVAVSASFLMASRDGAGHAACTHFMSVADARSLAAALLAAADHVDALTQL